VASPVRTGRTLAVSGRRAARRVFVTIVGVYGLGLLAWLFWPAFRESLVGKLVAIPLFSIYLLEHVGVSGLTDRSRCDWMWCAGTVLGIARGAGPRPAVSRPSRR